MKVLIASTPATGHLNPLLAIARVLISSGHEVVGLSSTAMRERIESAGARFHPFPAGADFDLRTIEKRFPEMKSMPPGPEMTLFLMTKVFFDAIPAQYEGLRQVLSGFAADVILGDNFMYGTFPFLLGDGPRPAIVLCGTMFLHTGRDDGAPNFAGLPPAGNTGELAHYAALYKGFDDAVFEPARQHLNALLAVMDVKPVTMNVFDASVNLPDVFLQLTVPEFEFPREHIPDSVRFVGALPISPNQAIIPEWAHELDGSKKVILVTQGTFSNHNFSQLIIPTIEALKNEHDLLLVVTTGGREIEAIPGPLPSNTRIASYLPFEWIFPKVDVFVTNGGYGSINQALSFGIPIVTAGLSEDKADVNARVAWSGVGIDLKTSEPTSHQLLESIRHVLANNKFQLRAGLLATRYAEMDTPSRILAEIEYFMSSADPLADGL